MSVDKQVGDLAKRIVDALLVDRDEWCDVGDGMMGPVADLDWNEMVVNVSKTIKQQFEEAIGNV